MQHNLVGIFRNLQKALAIYAKPTAGGEQLPIKDKSALIENLREHLTRLRAFCEARHIHLNIIRQKETFERIAKLDDAVEAILRNEEDKKYFLLMVSTAVVLHSS